MAGNYPGVALTVSDGRGGSDSETITIIIPKYTLIINIVGLGTVNQAIVELVPPSATYPGGTIVRLTAVPASGWAFSAWSGDLTGSANPADNIMSSDKTVTADPDDGFSGPWGFYNGLTWYETGNPGSPYNAWFRFTGITIPKGATILQAVSRWWRRARTAGSSSR